MPLNLCHHSSISAGRAAPLLCWCPGLSGGDENIPDVQSFCRTRLDSPAVGLGIFVAFDPETALVRIREKEDGAKGWNFAGCYRYSWAVVHQLSLEHIQIPPILQCLRALSTASLCTALKLMPENESLLENNLSFDYHFNAGSPGNICLCQAASLLLMWGIAGKGCWGNWKGAKPLGNALVAVRRRMRGDLCWMRHQGPTAHFTAPGSICSVVQGLTN